MEKIISSFKKLFEIFPAIGPEVDESTRSLSRKRKKINKTLLDFMSVLEYKHIKMIYFKIHFWGSGG